MRLVVTLAALVMPSLVAGQNLPAPADVQVLNGACKDTSHIARGPIGVDLTKPKYHVRYECDSAVISYHANRGTVMIQFAEKKGGAADAADIIGFAGPLDAQQIVHVERIYIAGSPNEVTEAACKLFYTGGKVSGIACGGQVDAGGTRTVPVIVFETR